MGVMTIAMLRKKLLKLEMSEEDVESLQTRDELQEAYDELSKPQEGEEPEPPEETEGEGEEDTSWIEEGMGVIFQDDEGEDVTGKITHVDMDDDGNVEEVKVVDTSPDAYEWTLVPSDISPLEEPEEGESGGEAEPEEGEGSDEGELELEVGMAVECPDPDNGETVLATITEIHEDGTLMVEDDEYEWEVNTEDITVLDSEPEEEEELVEPSSKDEKAGGRHPRDPDMTGKIEAMLDKGMKASEIAYTLMGCKSAAEARTQDYSRFNSLYHRVYAIRAKRVAEKEARKKDREKKAKAKAKTKAPAKTKAKAKSKTKVKAKAAPKKKTKVKAKRARR